MLKKIVKSCLLLVTFAIVLFSMNLQVFAESDYTTDEYIVDVQVAKDNSYTITEGITVNFIGEHHGIYRYIPEKGVKISDVYVEGEEYEVYSENGNQVIRIGSENDYLTGVHSYNIVYKMQVYKNREKSNDFMGLNVIPNNWETSINKAYVSVTMPEATDYSKLKLYSGAYGSKELSNNVTYEAKNGSKEINIYAEDLGERQGITLQLPLKAGYWENMLTSDWAKTAMIAIIVILPLLLLLLWFLLGRDPKVIKTVEFYPPNGMTPAELGYIVDGSVDEKDLISMIVYYADKGYLAIDEYDDKKFMVKKLKDIDNGEKKFSKVLFDGLFKKSDEVKLDELDEDFGESYETARTALSADEKVYSMASAVSRIFGMLAIAGVGFGMVALASFYKEFDIDIVFAVISALALLVTSWIILNAFDRRFSISDSSFKIKIILGIILYIASLALTMYFTSYYINDILLLICFSISAAVSMLPLLFMLARTKESADQLGKILGLREFIHLAEEPKLKSLVDENPKYFYNIIPYAYVLGLSDAWIKNFENIRIETPYWYSNSYGRDYVFDAYMFGTFMHNCHDSFSDNIHIPTPESDGSGGGFGGGDFSGGGFGGGGGGAW